MKKKELNNIICALFQNNIINSRYAIINCEQNFYSRDDLFYSWYWKNLGFVKIKRISAFGDKIINSTEPIEISEKMFDIILELNQLVSL